MNNNGWLSVLLSENPVSKKLKILTGNDFIPIEYRCFWNVPSTFFTEFESEVYFFYRDVFDDELDDYPPNYQIYICKNITFDEAVKIECWHPDCIEDKIFIGEVPTKDVIFDRTTREFVNTVVFEMIKPPRGI